MTAAARRVSAPRLAPAPTLVPRSHPELPPRNFSADREAIPTACGRIVERRVVDTMTNLYRLWEPAEDESDYSTTRRDKAGKLWGLVRTRRPAKLLGVVDGIYHEIDEWRRAIDIMRRTVRELSIRAPNGKCGGITEGIYEERGDLKLTRTPELVARQAEEQRRGGGR